MATNCVIYGGSVSLMDCFDMFSEHGCPDILKANLSEFLKHHVVMDYPLSTHDVDPRSAILLEDMVLQRPMDEIKSRAEVVKMKDSTDGILEKIRIESPRIEGEIRDRLKKYNDVTELLRVLEFRDPSILTIPSEIAFQISHHIQLLNGINEMFKQ